MARCGCGAAICSCLIEAEAPITVSGAGAPSNPYVIGIQYNGKSGCAAIAACVGDHLKAPLVYNAADGSIGLKVGNATGCAAIVACVAQNLGTGLEVEGGKLAVQISSESVNVLREGTSGDGLFVPVPQIEAGSNIVLTGSGREGDPIIITSAAEVGDTAIIAGDHVTITGSGTSADPFIVAADWPEVPGPSSDWEPLPLGPEWVPYSDEEAPYWRILNDQQIVFTGLVKRADGALIGSRTAFMGYVNLLVEPIAQGWKPHMTARYQRAPLALPQTGTIAQTLFGQMYYSIPASNYGFWIPAVSSSLAYLDLTSVSFPSEGGYVRPTPPVTP